MSMSAWPGDNPRPMHDSIRQQLARRAEGGTRVTMVLPVNIGKEKDDA